VDSDLPTSETAAARSCRGGDFPIGLQELTVRPAFEDVGDGTFAVALLPILGIERIRGQLRVVLPDRFAALAKQISSH
jgi:hypothetical protein